MKQSRLLYIPFGGASEIGMNCYAYGYGESGHERFIIVDCGIGFPAFSDAPGCETMFADISWLAARIERIDAVFITHAHEDHIGALGHMIKHFLSQRAIPIYARPFTAYIAAQKLIEQGLPTTALLAIKNIKDIIQVGHFGVFFVPISHSIPESSCLVIDTPVGRILHTGDFKIDETAARPNEPFDRALLSEIAHTGNGIKVMVCDSTNVFSTQKGHSETTLSAPLEKLFQSAQNMIVATTFPSNVARLCTLAQAGQKAGRKVVALGRSMQRMLKAAIDTKLIDRFQGLIDPQDMRGIARKDLLLLVTGTQGEPRAVSAQLANNQYRKFTVQKGDLFLFSSKTIPGNETAVYKVINHLSKQGVDIIEGFDGHFHVSGHANRTELDDFHNLIRPRIGLPMHGEHRHLVAHSAMFESKGICSVVASNGSVVDITTDRAVIVDRIQASAVYVDGHRYVNAHSKIIKERIKIALHGLVVLSVILDDDDINFGAVQIGLRGLPLYGQNNNSLVDTLETKLDSVLQHYLQQHPNKSNKKHTVQDANLEQILKQETNRIVIAETGKRAHIMVLISALSAF